MTLVKHAKDVARQWVLEEASRMPGFSGAFFHGSTNWLPDDAILPPASDVDVMIILDGHNPPNKLGKFIYRDVLLEVSNLSADQVQSPEEILGQSHMAGSFRAPGIIADPTGQLTKIQAVVSANYAKRTWVYRRCAFSRDKVLNNLQGVHASAPFHDQVMPWLFSAGVVTHVLLVAGLKNPTVRSRYLAVRNLLADYGHLDFYPTLLDLLGCARMSRERAEQHLAALADAFDVAKQMIKTPIFFAADISDHARPIAIDGSQELIENGNHREAIFWMAATYSRCQIVFAQDAPVETQERFTPGYRALLGDLGITSYADIQGRSDQIREVLPRVWEVAEAIIAANPEIEDGE